MDSKKILFISQEISPFLPSSSLADYSKNIPEAVQSAGLDLRVFAPRFGLINERRNQLHDVIRLSGINIIVNDTDHPLIMKVASIAESHLQVYFVDNDEFFKRKSMYKPDAKHQNTNLERSIFFIRGAFEAIHKLRWIPDIIHCAGWFSAFAPLYLRTYYKNSPCLGNAKIIFSAAHNEEAGELGDNLKEIIAFDKIPHEMIQPLVDDFSVEGMKKLGITYADGVSLIAENEADVEELANYAKQMQKPTIICSPTADADGQKHSDLYRSLL